VWLYVPSLCSGVGGLDAGLRLALGDGVRTVCYVERDAYAAAVLVARMEDSSLDRAPVWDDLLTFDGSEWRGSVDLIVAGFPCQPWSVAGSRRGTDDARWIWPDIARIIGEVGPTYVFLENVPGLVSGGGLGEVLGSLASLGFDAVWESVRASDAGAPHRRERVFILGRERGAVGVDLGNADGARRPRLTRLESLPGPHSEEWGPEPRLPSGDALADAIGYGLSWSQCAIGRDGLTIGSSLKDVADAGCLGIHSDEPFGFARSGLRAAPREEGSGMAVGVAMGDPDGTRLEGHGIDTQRPDELPAWPPSPEERAFWGRVLERWPDLAPAIEPSVRGVAGGSADRVDRLRALGNGVVPQQVALAFRILADRI